MWRHRRCWRRIVRCQGLRWHYTVLAVLGVERSGVAESMDCDVCLEFRERRDDYERSKNRRAVSGGKVATTRSNRAGRDTTVERSWWRIDN